MKNLSMTMIAILVLVLLGRCGVAACPQSNEVSIEKQDGVVVVNVGGKLFTKYDFKSYKRPIFFPVLGPGQVSMTRCYPMQKVPGEASDHPHHKSIWFAHGVVDGVDFWKEDGSIKHSSFDAFDPAKGFTVTDHLARSGYAKTTAGGDREI